VCFGTEYVVKADFNGDGKTDLAATNSIPNNLPVILGNGDGTQAFPNPATNTTLSIYPDPANNSFSIEAGVNEAAILDV